MKSRKIKRKKNKCAVATIDQVILFILALGLLVVVSIVIYLLVGKFS